MPEGSLVHKGEQPPSKFSRWVSLQAKNNPKEVQAIQKKKIQKMYKQFMKLMASQIGLCKRSSQEGKYPKSKNQV
jgi:hypothetical protein